MKRDLNSIETGDKVWMHTALKSGKITVERLPVTRATPELVSIASKSASFWRNTGKVTGGLTLRWITVTARGNVQASKRPKRMAANCQQL